MGIMNRSLLNSSYEVVSPSFKKFLKKKLCINFWTFFFFFNHHLIVFRPAFGHRSPPRPWCRPRWRAAPRSSALTTLASRLTWRSRPSSTWRPAYPPWATPSAWPSPTGPSSPAPAGTCLSECNRSSSVLLWGGVHFKDRSIIGRTKGKAVNVHFYMEAKAFLCLLAERSLQILLHVITQ